MKLLEKILDSYKILAAEGSRNMLVVFILLLLINAAVAYCGKQTEEVE